MKKIKCKLCPHHCNLKEDQIGLCKGRANIEASIKAINYGMIASMALDAIEKKPLRRFYPGSKIFSVGSFGCNLSCSFCQNHEISMVGENKERSQYKKPDDLIEMALDLVTRGNIGIAYTYNEPLIGYEYVKDCAVLAKKNNLKNVLVTNGCFCEEPVRDLLPYIDALNVDLKAFTNEFYKELGGDLETVKNFIKLASEKCHVEVTTLIIPGKNDSEEEIRALSKFLASLNKDIPLHISRFFPQYKMRDIGPTEVSKVFRLADIARESLNYVYEGNC